MCWQAEFHWQYFQGLQARAPARHGSPPVKVSAKDLDRWACCPVRMHMILDVLGKHLLLTCTACSQLQSLQPVMSSICCVSAFIVLIFDGMRFKREAQGVTTFKT